MLTIPRKVVGGPKVAVAYFGHVISPMYSLEAYKFVCKLLGPVPAIPFNINAWNMAHIHDTLLSTAA